MPKSFRTLQTVLLGSLILLLGCGLKIKTCVSNPDKNQFHCYDERSEQSTIVRPAHVVKWSCLSLIDHTALLGACAEGNGIPPLNHCTVGPEEENFLFHCFDTRTQKGNFIPFAESDKFVCVNLNDFIEVLDWCDTQRREKGK